MTDQKIARRMWPVVWAPLSVVAVHSALSVTLGHQRDLDPVFHFLGGAAGAYALLQAMSQFPAAVPSLAARHRTAIVIGLVCVVTLLWEVMEFGSDRLLGTHVQLGPGDTWADIALGTSGGAMAAVLAALISRRRMDAERRTI